MRIVGGNHSLRTVYAFEANGEFLLSPSPEVRGGRRPIGRFDSRDELEAYAAARRCEVQWQPAVN